VGRIKLPGWLRLLLGAGLLGCSAGFSGLALFVLLGFLVALTALLNPPGLRLFLRVRFWVLIASPLLVSALFHGPRDLQLLLLRFSSQGLAVGLAMSLRALCLVLTFQIMLAGLSTSEMIRLFDARGMKGLGFALGVAHNMLFTLADTSRTVLDSLRLRGGIRRQPLRSISLFVVAVVSGTLRHGEEIARAAQARAFDPE